MIIPINVPVEVATSAEVASGATDAVIATFQTPKGCAASSIQFTVGEAFNINNTHVVLSLVGGLDNVNYPASAGNATAGGSVLTGTGGVASSPPQQYFQVQGANTDSINHTVSVWVLLK